MSLAPSRPPGSVTRVVERGLRALCAAASAIGAAALAGLFLVVLLAVLMRYGWSRPLAFTEELAGLLMTVAVFTLLPVTVLQEINIRVTVLSERLQAWPQRLLFWLGQALLVAFAIVFTWQAWAITAFTAKLNLLSEQSRMPLAPFLLLCTLSMGLVGIVGAWRAWHVAQPAAGEKARA